MIRKCNDNITRGVRRVAVIGKYIINKYCADAAVVRVGVTMCGRRKNAFIKPKKFEMPVTVFCLSRFELKSPRKTSVLFSNESFSKRSAR